MLLNHISNNQGETKVFQQERERERDYIPRKIAYVSEHNNENHLDEIIRDARKCMKKSYTKELASCPRHFLVFTVLTFPLPSTASNRSMCFFHNIPSKTYTPLYSREEFQLKTLFFRLMEKNRSVV